MAGATQTMAAQVYERPTSDCPPGYHPLSVIGMITDVYWDDSHNQYLRGFNLADTKMTYGTGLSILNYYHKPYEPATDKKNAVLEMHKYKRGKFVLATFKVYDTYEEAVNDQASLYTGYPCIATPTDY